MERQYFSIEEAARATEKTEGDIKHFIETGALKGCLYITKRKFLVCIGDQASGQYATTGTAFYRGLVTTSHENLLNILEQQSAIVRSFVPLDKEQLSGYSTVTPFKSGMSPYPRIEWKAESLEKALQATLNLLALPDIYKPLSRSFVESLEVVGRSNGIGVTENEVKELKSVTASQAYDFEKQWRFSESDIRITRSSLLSSGLLKTKMLEDKERNSDDVKAKLPWCEGLKGKCTGIDRVIERAYRSLSEPQTKEVWNVISDDKKSGNFRFDIDAIIESVDGDQILWELQDRSKFKSLSFKTFENKLSAIRKAYSQ